MDNSCKVPEVKPITIKRFGTAGLVPTVPTTLDCNLWQKTDLKDGEFAINTVDDKLYIRSGNQIIELTNQSSGGGTGTVTSVGLSMPSAFAVANSPVTSSGTLTVTGAGVVSQYIRGDGSLANFPASTGGGASQSFYLNGSVSQGTFGGVAFREMDRVPILGAGTDFTINTNGYIQSFITDAGVPNLLEIPAGNWNFETYFSASSGGGSPSFYLELYKWDGATLSLIASNSATPESITNGTAIDLYVSALAVPQTTLLATDRLAVRIYVNNSGRTITLHTENNHLCQVITTFSTGLNALNGLTAQVQNFAVGTSGTDFAISSATDTHTFNLPTASALNRGALSSSDWSTFNNKVSTGAITGSGLTMATARLLGRSTAGSGAVEEITIGSGLTLSAGTLTAAGGSGITIGTTAIASGTVNRILFQGAGNVVQQDSTFVWNNTDKRLILGTEAVADTNSRLVVIGKPSGTGTIFAVHNSTGTNNALVVRDNGVVAVHPNLSLIPPTNFHVGGTGNIAAFGSSSTIDRGVAINVAANGHGRITAFSYSNADPSSTNISIGAVFGFNGSGNNFYGIGIADVVSGRFDVWFQTGNTNGGGYRFYTGGVNERLRIVGTTGNVLIGTTTDVASSILTLESTTKGFLPPRMTTAQRDLIGTPATGLTLYNTSTNTLDIRSSASIWNKFGSETVIIGNGTTSSTFGLQVHNSTGTNNALVVRDDTRVGIGTNAPATRLHVVGASDERIRVSNGSNNIELGCTSADNSFVKFGSGLLLRQNGTTSQTLDLLPTGTNASTIFAIRGGTGNNTLINMQVGGATNVSIISLYRGTTESIRLVDNNANDSYFNTNRSFVFGGTARSSASALVEMISTTQGFLPPRMTTAERNLIGTPATGLTLYNTTTNTLDIKSSAASVFNRFGSETLIVGGGNTQTTIALSVQNNSTNNNSFIVSDLGNIGIGTTSAGTSATKTLVINNGTAPSGNVTDSFQQYSADIVAGNAAPHFRTENGNIIKLYQETTGIAAAAFVANTSLIFDDSATYGGYTMGQVVAALKAQGLLA